MISHFHKTIFVHIPKTAGQSVEMVFLQDLGLTWKDRHQLHMKYNWNPGRGPQRLAHLYADEYRQLGYVTEEEFAGYTRFSIVRHPYDRAVSEFRFRCSHPGFPMGYVRRFAPWPRGRGKGRLDFSRFLGSTGGSEYFDKTRHLVPQTRFLTDSAGELLVDPVLRFETLADDISPVFQKIFGGDRKLPEVNRTSAEAGFTKNDLTREHKDLIFEMYRDDFERFGYLP